VSLPYLGRSSAAKNAGLLVLRHEVLLCRTSLQPYRIRRNLRVKVIESKQIASPALKAVSNDL
jgi:hypothetical protein